MSDAAEWGPWIEHDGKPAPDAQGRYCNVIASDGRDECGIVQCAIPQIGYKSMWLWDTLGPREAWVCRYRIRRPKALRDLIELVETLPAPAQPMVDA